MERRKHYRALLALQRVPELGLRRIKLLLEKTGVKNADEIFDLPVSKLASIDSFGEQIVRNIVTFDGWMQVDKVLDKTDKTGAELVSIDDEEYPPLLRHIYDPPVLLWLKGNRKALLEDGIAIIGTRRPGKYGLQQCEKWSRIISESGLCINSGLAYGIDAAAHKTAVDTGGKTVAVLGSGIDVIYPSKNIGLVKNLIQKGGAVITEFPPGTKPDAVNFPERNRIVSGMSHGVLVVESGIKGGSMITARSALDQNREVFVIPHPLDYLKGEGCNYLIRTGQGKLVQNMEDIREEISVHIEGTDGEIDKTPQVKKWESMDLNPKQSEVCRQLAKKEHHIDELSENLNIQAHKLLPLLLELEMLGAVKQKAGKYFELC